MTILSIINQLAATRSRTEKLAILKANQENKTLRQVFHMALDPMVTFGIEQIPPFKTACATQTLDWALGELQRGVPNGFRGGSGAAAISNILSSVSADDAEVIIRIIGKDAKCGVGDATANSVWPGSVFVFPLMKASPYRADLVEAMTGPMFSQEKLDGARGTMVFRDGVVTVFSSSGREIETHGCFDYLAQFCDGVVLDGEILCRSGDDSLRARKAANGIVNKAIKGTISQKEASQLQFVAFDLIDQSHWMAGSSPVKYSERYLSLVDLSDNFGPNATLVSTRMVNNLEEAWVHFRELLAEGKEGTIVKDPNSGWCGERSRLHVKFKDQQTCDLLVVEEALGTGKNANRLGTVRCVSSDGQVDTWVGTGFTDDQRVMGYYPGRIIEVEFHEKTLARGAKAIALSHGRFLRERNDKSVADTIDNIPGRLVKD